MNNINEDIKFKMLTEDSIDIDRVITNYINLVTLSNILGKDMKIINPNYKQYIRANKKFFRYIENKYYIKLNI